MPILRSNDFHSNNLLAGKRTDRTKKTLRILMQIPGGVGRFCPDPLLFAETRQVVTSSIIICVAELCTVVVECGCPCLQSSSRTAHNTNKAGTLLQETQFRDDTYSLNYIKTLQMQSKHSASDSHTSTATFFPLQSVFASLKPPLVLHASRETSGLTDLQTVKSQ